MKYYWMMYDFDKSVIENYIISTETINDTLPDYSVCCVKYVENWNPDTTLICNNLEETVVPDYLCDVKDWMVVSYQFIDAIRPFEDGAIQYLPIKVDAVQPQMQGKKYYVANVIRVLDVLDYEKSDWFYMSDNKTRALVFGVLKREAIKNNHIFIIKRDLLSDWVIVSETVKDVIEKAKLVGFKFCEMCVI